jgi:LCP family protein required for cell wall assembly
VLVGGEPGPWGPQVSGGRRWRVLSRAAAVLGVFALVALAAIGTTGLLLVQQAETNLTRVPVPELERSVTPNTARHFLVVGSDARDGLADSDRAELSLGSFDGQRSDTIIYVAISEDREHVSLVSLPRDLLVIDGDRQRKLTDTFAGGPDDLVRVVRENFGVPVNHYAEISLSGFIEVVRTLGGVEICLDEALVDPKSGADFAPGCQEMSPQEALSYVRSRRGPRADFERIERQQRFLRAVLSELTSARILADPVRLFQIVDDVATNVTTDDGLNVAQMRGLADEMRQVVREGMPMATVPAYNRRVNGVEYMVRYGPGADAMFDDLRSGRPLAERGSREQRDGTVVALYSGGRGPELDIVHRTLLFAGFQSGGAGTGPPSTDAGRTTTVFSLPGEDRRAAWVAATLGAPVRPLPADVTPPDGAHVVVGIGSDASD